MRAVAASAETNTLSARGYATLLRVTRVLGWHASWATLRTRPTRARAAALCGCSERTITRWWRWLEQRGYLAVTEPGTLPQYRPGVLHAGDGALAREFILTVPGPSGDCFVTPTEISSGSEKHYPRAHARESGVTRKIRGDKAGLRRVSIVARRIRPATIDKILGPFMAAGWSLADIQYAIDHTPDGCAHWHTHAVRLPASWLACRLRAWMGESGPVPSHTSRLAIRATQARAARMAARASHEEKERSRAPGPVQASMAQYARRLLAARRGVIYDQ